MKLGIQVHAAGVSLSDSVSVLASLGVKRCRSTVHNWVHKAGLQPHPGKTRITWRSTKPRFSAMTSDTGCTPLSILSRTSFSMSASIRFERSSSQNGFSKNWPGNTTSPIVCFSLMAHPSYKPPCISYSSDFSMLHMEMGIPSNACSKN
jgi:hypothetical protein